MFNTAGVRVYEFVGHGHVRRGLRPFPRPRAWAVYEGRVGIIEAINGATSEFHACDKRGDTWLVVMVPTAALTQATLQQIPDERRPAEHRAARFGYTERVR